MVDRSIPFYNLILRCDHPSPAEPILPEGFFLRPYTPGDEALWAALEYEAGDFGSSQEAEDYFRRTYTPHADALRERCWFVIAPDGGCAGTCIAWRDPKGERAVASLHWLVVSERYQRSGLGRALCQKVLNVFAEQGEAPVYIHTQPWSWKAVLLYGSMGFRIQRSDTFARYENQYPLAMAALQNVLTAKQLAAVESRIDP